MDTKKSSVNLVVAGLLLGLFMSALDQTIVSTAMTTIIEKLGGLDLFTWVYSAYMIAMVVSTPIFGKLSDMFGRKLFFLLGVGLFILGSVLCGTAQNMDQLIVYRALQGIGGGALMPIVFTIIFDLFPQEKRGKMMGLFGAVFGLSSVFGPILGGAITDNMSWRWIFYINVPIGLLSFLFVLKGYRESANHRKQSIDWLGAITLTASILCLMFALELGGTDGWGSWQIISLFVACGVLLVGFILAELRAKDPIIALSLFKNRLFTSSMMIGFLYNAAMIAFATYIPLFIQGVFHKSATETSTVLIPMMLGNVVSAQIGGRVATKFRFRDSMVLSAIVLAVGCVLLGYVMDLQSSQLAISLFMIVVGLGIGISFSLLNISTLSSVPPQYKGSASSLITFFRTIGATIGVTVFGVLQKNDFQSAVKSLAGANGDMVEKIKGGQALLDPIRSAQMGIPSEALAQMLNKLGDSILYVFQWTIVLPVIALLFALLMGKARLPAVGRGRPQGGAPEEGKASDRAATPESSPAGH